MCMCKQLGGSLKQASTLGILKKSEVEKIKAEGKIKYIINLSLLSNSYGKKNYFYGVRKT